VPESLKQSAAIAITRGEGWFLAVRRSNDDEVLPGVWGLPAASVREGETPEQAAVRAGRDKLGVEVEVLRRIGEEEAYRGGRAQRLVEYEARIVSGVPSVPQQDASVSQYAELRFTADPAILFEAARQGSLCSRIYLRSRGLEPAGGDP
jgi:ADP-ribose pyrophosphatase YjhB (NUDIX family)